MQDAQPPAESREPEPTPPPFDAPATPSPMETPNVMEAPKSSAELLPPTVVATAPPPPPPPPEFQAAPAAAPAAAPQPVQEKGRWWAVFSHLLLFAAIPTIFLGGVLTFFLWQLAGKNDGFVEDQAREALNFQINVGLLSFVLAGSLLGLPLVIVLWVVACVVCLVAARHASRGERYRYPVILRVVTH